MAPKISTEVAKAALQQMNSQLGLFVSLSLAICGGLLLLMLQTAVHNHDRAKQPITFRTSVLLFAAFVCQVFSACFGLACIAAVTDAVPAIFHEDFNHINSLTEASFGSDAVYYSGLGQVVFFILSLVLMILFLVRNWRLIAKSRKGLLGGRFKMRVRRTLHLVPAMAVLIAMPSLCIPARTQQFGGDDHPLLPENRATFHKEVLATWATLVEISSSEPKQRDLVLAVDAALGHRIIASPLGYEQNADFIQTLKETRARFIAGLSRLTVPQPPNLSEFETVAYNAYSENFTTFSNFVRGYYGASHVPSQVLRPTLFFRLLFIRQIEKLGRPQTGDLTFGRSVRVGLVKVRGNR